MKYPQPFPRREVDPARRAGWVVDLSPAGAVNPDCYWYFDSRALAREFLTLMNTGLTAREALASMQEEIKS